MAPRTEREFAEPARTYHVEACRRGTSADRTLHDREHLAVRSPAPARRHAADGSGPEVAVTRVGALLASGHHRLSELVVYEKANHALFVAFPPGLAAGYAERLAEFVHAVGDRK